MIHKILKFSSRLTIDSTMEEDSDFRKSCWLPELDPKGHSAAISSNYGQLAAAQGHADAQYNKGEDVPQN